MITLGNKIKRFISPYIHSVAYYGGFSSYLSRRREGLKIFMYHGVGSSDCPSEVFESQMHYISQNFKVISLKEALKKMDSEYSFKSEIVLTFDDGLRNNFTIAYPILKHLNIPATFFVCPGLIETGSWVWAYEAGQRLIKLGDTEIQAIEDYMYPEFKNSFAGNRYEAVAKAVEWMKTLSTEDRKEIEQELRRITPTYVPSSMEKNDFDMMNWEELRLLSPELITIGSHSVSHPILTNLLQNDMVYEIVESKHWLEKELSVKVDFFCYPNGNYDEKVLELVKNNYLAAVTTEAGFVYANDDCYKLNRLPAAENLQLFAWRLFRPTA